MKLSNWFEIIIVPGVIFGIGYERGQLIIFFCCIGIGIGKER